jgi:hypothetical protein
MSGLWDAILLFPSWMLAAIAGAGSAMVAGWLVSRFTTQRNWKFAAAIPVALTIAISVQLALRATQDVKGHAALEKAMVVLKENRLFSALMRNHPEIEPRIRSGLQQLLEEIDDEKEMFTRSQQLTGVIVAEYFPAYMLKGSDEALFKVMQRTLESLENFRETPALCVSYYMGTPDFKQGDMTDAFIAAEANIKADLIESASHATPFSGGSIDRASEMIIESYARNGYAIDNLSLVDRISALPPRQGCDIAIEFMKAVVSLGEVDASYVWKTLLTEGS